MPTLPTGVVTFLFTDIEASTRMLEEHRAAAGPALARHHELLLEAVEAANGVVFETVGDAVYAAFTKPADGLIAATAIQRAMEAADWGEIGRMRVRIAVHTGAVETRGDHYFGSALFECARLQALAHGGQTITSAATAALATAGLPPDIALRPMGRHRLKDLDQPMEVVQVNGAGLQDQFPPLRASTSIPNNLPTETTAFVGRDDDLARVAELMEQSRLVTLLGPGGTGKTRLAIQSAALQLDRFPDGVWLVELAPITQPELVITEIADTWGLRAGEGATIEEVVTTFLSSRHLLLVVDNCEHVRETAANLLNGLLRSAPKVSVVATSRESLGVPGETAYRVPALGLPDADASDAQAASSDAVRLFVDRVRAARPDFTVGDADLAAIVRVCRRLDGMPLGLELAAARLRTLSPAELADRLDTSFRILSGGGSKTALPRQRTLQATIDWSHDLLSAAERAVFRRLAVFSGGFDLAAAESVTCGDGVEDWEVLDHLNSLVDKSLVLRAGGMTEQAGAASRFRLLAPVAEYARDALIAAGQADATRLAHARYYAGVARQAEPHIRGHDQLEWSRRLDTDLDNLRAAVISLRERGEIEACLDLCFDLYMYWQHDGMHVEGVGYTLAGLQAGGGDLEARDARRAVRGWYEAALLALDITDRASVRHAERGLAVAQASGDPVLIARMEMALGAAIKNTTERDDGDAHVLAGEAGWLATLDDGFWDSPWESAQLSLIRGAFLPANDRSRQGHFEDAIRGFRELGDDAMLALTLIVSNFLTGRADDEWIFRNIREAVAIARANGYRQSLGHALYYYGARMRRRGEGAVVRGELAEAARILGEIGDRPCSSGAAMQLAGIEAADGDPARARARLAGVVRAITNPDDGTLDRATDFACLVALEGGEPETAARFLGQAESTSPEGPRAMDLPEYRARLEAILEPATLARLAAEGAAMTRTAIAEQIGAWADASVPDKADA